MSVTTDSQHIHLPGDTHPGLLQVVRQGTPEQFSSKLVVQLDYAKGASVVDLKGLTPGPKRYSSVQISATEHVELNSDLVFMNHSCDPSVHLDVDRMAIVALKDLKAGDELTFFYPSTEWDMAQPFACWCGSPKCIETVRGAKHLSTSTLNQFVLSNHIQQLIKDRDAQS
ncbi:uncharacterized protein BX664DRAFT_277370 [Halteromyces radiatus]|uniref:uncharacterized protein n=1 Tax=Halteromyces radiatus TaxID=101107 RepID=UPI0022210276|nr:uncharacterized protein BX664DRAFT_277370 [Halteromyces radiatus]KAI8092824.1 hypothetical protein BX664DRAFT_277370 [Halteromyces radiatus]